MLSFFAGLNPLYKFALNAVFIVALVTLGLWWHVRAVDAAAQRGYDKRVAEEQAMALGVARDAARATAQLRDVKQQLDANYAKLQNEFQRAVARNHTAAVRLRSAIGASRVAAATPGGASAQCSTASQRDGELLADMERQGGAMAAEAGRLAHKVTGLQTEVQFYYRAANADEIGPNKPVDKGFAPHE